MKRIQKSIYAAAAKSLQSCPTLCDPMDSSPPGSSVHRILQARILDWVAISFSRVYIYMSMYTYIYIYTHITESLYCTVVIKTTW